MALQAIIGISCISMWVGDVIVNTVAYLIGPLEM